jgi:hypothetical protein
VNVTNIHNVYNTTVINNTSDVNRVSYNGGEGGVTARPTPEEEAAAHDQHLPPAAAQTQHIQAARSNPEFRASANHGKPPVAATAKPGEFTGHDVVPAREAGAPYNPPTNRGAAAPRAENGGHSTAPPATAVHPNDLPPMERPAAPNTGDPNLDKKYQQQQQKLQQKQDQERQKLQQQQDKEHQQLAKQNANEQTKQQTEQKHQQQTQQLQQKHVQQQQSLQQRQAPPSRPPAGRPKG